MATDYFNQFNNDGIPFMEGRDKGDIQALVGEVLHVEDYGFIRTPEGRYAVIAFREHPDAFYFAGQVLTNILGAVTYDNKSAELKEQSLVLQTRTSRNGNDYMGVRFI